MWGWFVLAAGTGALGGLLILIGKRWPPADDPMVRRINEQLPQTQCGQCGHPGCLPYAEAVAQGEAHNKCAPGGKATVIALAELLAREIIPLDPAHGAEVPPRVATIREAECIGCTKCIQACPVDAILGASQYMHTVIQAECTGCDLCVDPCPVDCIDMHPRPEYLDQLTALEGRR